MKIHVRFLRDSEFESLLEIAEWATPPYFFPFNGKMSSTFETKLSDPRKIPLRCRLQCQISQYSVRIE